MVRKKCPLCGEKIEDENNLKQIKEYLVIKEPFWSFFFEMTKYLIEHGVKMIFSSFGEWARDECGKAIIIFGSLVNQNIYDDVMKQLRSKPEETEEK